jgi:hypothetical protein
LIGPTHRQSPLIKHSRLKFRHLEGLWISDPKQRQLCKL